MFMVRKEVNAEMRQQMKNYESREDIRHGRHPHLMGSVLGVVVKLVTVEVEERIYAKSMVMVGHMLIRGRPRLS